MFRALHWRLGHSGHFRSFRKSQVSHSQSCMVYLTTVDNSYISTSQFVMNTVSFSCVARYNHRQDTLEECRQEVREILEQSLAKRGIQAERNRLSSKQLESRMESLRSEQEGRAKVETRRRFENKKYFESRKPYFV